MAPRQSDDMPYRASIVRPALLILLAACSSTADGTTPRDEARTSIHLEGVGGQTGMEGGCLLNRVAALPFTTAQAEALLFRETTTTLAPQGESGAKVMRVKVTRAGDAETELDCGGSLRQPVEITLSLDDPPLDLSFVDRAFVFQHGFALLQRRVPDEVAQRMGLAGPNAGPRKFDDNAATLMLAFGEDGVRGTLDPDSQCGLLVFPAGRRCLEGGSVDLPLASVPPSLLAGVDDLNDLPHMWSDGTSTTLSVDLEGDPDGVCSDFWPPDVPGADEAKLHVAVRARVRSADGRLDLRVPASIESGTPHSDGWGSWVLSIGAYLPAQQVRTTWSDFPSTERDLAWLEFSAARAEGQAPSHFLALTVVPTKLGAPAPSLPIHQSVAACSSELGNTGAVVTGTSGN